MQYPYVPEDEEKARDDGTGVNSTNDLFAVQDRELLLMTENKKDQKNVST